MLKISICDDDKCIHDELNELLLNYSIQSNQDFDVQHFYRAEDLLEAPYDYNILFLDIMLNDDYDGINIGKEMRKKNNHALYIIVTSREDRYADAFEATTFRYLLKPITQNKVNKILKEAQEFITNSEKYLKFSFSKSDYYIHIQEIVLIESYMRKRYVCTEHIKFQTIEKWKVLLKQLEDYQCFTQIGKSYFVNMTHIRSISSKSITLDNGRVINLNKYAEDKFQKEFNIFLSGKGEIN